MSKIQDLPNEEWLDIPNFDGHYQVSNLGRIKSLKYGKERLKKCHNNKLTGYQQCILCINGKTKNFLVHRLVCDTFIPNPHNLNRVNHKDLDKMNNTAENLEWTDQLTNIHHYYTSNGEKKPREMRTVLAYDVKTNQFIGEYVSINQAAKALKTGPETVWRYLKGYVTNPKKYIFKFK